MQPSNFDRISAATSTKIYKTLCQGQVINQLIVDKHTTQAEENPLYTLLFNEQVHFTHLYQHIGFELIFEPLGSFFYVRNSDYSCVDEADENALKIQTMLTIIGHYYTSKGQDLDLLSDPNFGISNDDIAVLTAHPMYSAILNTTKHKNVTAGREFLIKRGFAFDTGGGSFILSQAGMLFLTRLQESNANELIEDE